MPGPSPTAPRSDGAGRRTLVIACGALAREIVDMIRLNAWTHLAVTCLPAIWHNTPARIPEAVRAKIRAARDDYDSILVAYGDCGTGGQLDAVLAEEGVARIEGPHCYAFYRGVADFTREAEDDPTCFYLTDYLVRHFERLIVQGLGLDRHPELLSDYFGNYTRLVYLAQSEDPEMAARARQAAARLGLAYDYRLTGYGQLAGFLNQVNEA
ncbi:MAG: DUF1638 domain-containing protein [Kiloniellaceae bacterium]